MPFIILLTCLTLFYLGVLVWLARGFARLRKQRHTVRALDRLPRVSVVVAARNEGRNLPRLLECLQQQEYPREKLECIIVDDRSTDGSWDLLQRAAESISFLKPLRVTDTVAGFAPKKRALDTGIRGSTGEFLLLTDADCSPPPHWVSEMVACYDDETAMVLGYSPYRFDVPMPSLVRGMLAIDYFALGAVTAGAVGAGFPLTANGTNLSYRRTTFDAVRGFESIKTWISGDDDLFMQEVRGHHIGTIGYALSPEAHVPAAAPTRLRQFWHQRIRYASKGRKYDVRMTAGLVLAYLFNAVLALGLPAGLLFPGGVLSAVGAAWVVKVVADFLFLWPVAGEFREKAVMKFYLPTALLHPFYITAFGFLGSAGAFRWKEEPYQNELTATSSPGDPRR